jgi:hypothetical protein
MKFSKKTLRTPTSETADRRLSDSMNITAKYLTGDDAWLLPFQVPFLLFLRLTWCNLLDFLIRFSGSDHYEIVGERFCFETIKRLAVVAW